MCILQTRTLQTRKFSECEGYTIYCYCQSVSDYFLLISNFITSTYVRLFVIFLILACNFRTRKVIFTEKMVIPHVLNIKTVNLSISIPAFQKNYQKLSPTTQWYFTDQNFADHNFRKNRNFCDIFVF